MKKETVWDEMLSEEHLNAERDREARRHTHQAACGHEATCFVVGEHAAPVACFICSHYPASTEGARDAAPPPERFPFFARITEPLRFNTTGTVAAGAIVQALRTSDRQDAYYVRDASAPEAEPYWTLARVLVRLCDICEEEDAIQAAAFHHGVMLCGGCAAQEPGWETEYQADCAYEAERLRLLAAQGSKTWHLEEA